MSIFGTWEQGCPRAGENVSKHLTWTGFIQVVFFFSFPSLTHTIIKMKELHADSLTVKHNFLHEQERFDFPFL